MSNTKLVSVAPSQVSDETLRNFVGYHLKRSFNVIQADLTQTLKPFGLRMLTFTALVLIVDNPGLSQSQLADAMDIERPNLVIIIDELEQRELIERNRVQTDKRIYALRATLAGKRLYKKAVAADMEHEARLLAGLDKETRKSLMTTLEALGRHLQKCNRGIS
jgi:DNA-binding MarR family transcriptional regulator